MSNGKVYLNVPFAEKDAAKALGARWDPAHKKWYISPTLALAPFAAWLEDAAPSAASKPAVKSNKSGVQAGRVVTPAADLHFVAYNGDAPPWD